MNITNEFESIENCPAIETILGCYPLDIRKIASLTAGEAVALRSAAISYHIEIGNSSEDKYIEDLPAMTSTMIAGEDYI